MKTKLLMLLLACIPAHATQKQFRVVYEYDGRQLSCLVRAENKNIALITGSDCCYKAMFDLPVHDLIDVCTNPTMKELK